MSTHVEHVTWDQGIATLNFAIARWCGSTLIVTVAYCGIGPVYKLSQGDLNVGAERRVGREVG